MRWLSIDEVRSLTFWKALAVEFLGTGILVFVGCGAAVTSDKSQGTDAFVTRVALAFGLTVATMVWCIAGVSSGHINPAVTLAFLVTRKITLLRGLLYVVVQCLGAMTGAGLLAASVPSTLREGSFGCTLFQDISSIQAILIETLITFVLILTIFANCERRQHAADASKPGDLNGSGSLAIGISVLICHLAAIPLTGSSMNPARSLGPAVIRGGLCWTDHWVYWVGPLLGGAIAGLLHDFIIAEDASLRKFRHCAGCLDSYDPVDVLDNEERTALI